MSTALFGYPVFSDVGTVYSPSFSGGNWTTALPLSNVQDRKLSLVARSSGVTTADTLFTADLGVSRRIGILGVYGHTMSRSATLRWRGMSAVPCFDSLTVGDASWTASGTPTRSAAAFTSSDGVPLDLIGDDSGAAQEYYTKAVTFTGNAAKLVAFRIKKGTIIAAGGSAVLVADITAASEVLHINITWSGTTPVLTYSAGSAVSATLLPNGDYRIVALTASVTAAHTFAIGCYGAEILADQGNLYIGDVTLWDATSDQLGYDSGYADVWRTVYPAGSLPAADPRMVDNKYSAEEVAQLPGIPVTTVISTPVSARYWRCNITDTSNSAGHLDIGRVMICDSVAPSINMSFGAAMSMSSASTRTETDGGGAIYRDQPRRREMVFTIDNLGQDEALAQFWEMQRRLGTTGQLVFVFDSADTYHMPRRAMPCVLKELSKFQYPWGTATTIPFALVEEL